MAYKPAAAPSIGSIAQFPGRITEYVTRELRRVSEETTAGAQSISAIEATVTNISNSLSAVTALVATLNNTSFVVYGASTDPVSLSIGPGIEWSLSGTTLTLSTQTRRKVRYATGNVTVSASDEVIIVDATSGAATVSMPTLASSQGRQLVIKKSDASGNPVVLDGSGTETIDGALTQSIGVRYASLTVLGGNEWAII